MTRTLPATGLTLPDETTGWSLSTPRHSDWRALPGGGGVSTTIRLDGHKVGTLTWDTTNPPEVTLDDQAEPLWQAAAEATAQAPDPRLSTTGHDGATLLALTLIAETNTARTYNTWSRTSTVLSGPAPGPDHVHVVSTADRDRACRWAVSAGGYSSWWDPGAGSWTPLLETPAPGAAPC